MANRTYNTAYVAKQAGVHRDTLLRWLTQAGAIIDTTYLDELRDVVKKQIGSEVPTPTWSAKRDSISSDLRNIIDTLPEPNFVSVDKYREMEDKYLMAMENIKNKEIEIERLQQCNSDLSECKEQEQVDAVRRKYSNTDDNFTGLCDDAKEALGKLNYITKEAIFKSNRSDKYYPDKEDWDEVERAKDTEEVMVDIGECEPNDSHPRVKKAINAIHQLDKFINELEDDEFRDKFEIKYEIPLSIKNRDFWNNFL